MSDIVFAISDIFFRRSIAGKNSCVLFLVTIYFEGNKKRFCFSDLVSRFSDIKAKNDLGAVVVSENQRI